MGHGASGRVRHGPSTSAPHKRLTLQTRLTGCALILPPDRFDDLTLLLPSGKTAAAVLTSRSWDTYTRSDLYVEPDTLG